MKKLISTLVTIVAVVTTTTAFASAHPDLSQDVTSIIVSTCSQSKTAQEFLSCSEAPLVADQEMASDNSIPVTSLPISVCSGSKTKQAFMDCAEALQVAAQAAGDIKCSDSEKTFSACMAESDKIAELNTIPIVTLIANTDSLYAEDFAKSRIIDASDKIAELNEIPRVSIPKKSDSPYNDLLCRYVAVIPNPVLINILTLGLLDPTYEAGYTKLDMTPEDLSAIKAQKKGTEVQMTLPSLVKSDVSGDDIAIYGATCVGFHGELVSVLIDGVVATVYF